MRPMRFALVLLCLCIPILGGCEYVRPTGVPSTTWVPLPTVAPPSTETPLPVTPSPTLIEPPTLTPLPMPTARATEASQETKVPGSPGDWAVWARDMAWQHLWQKEAADGVSQFPEWVEVEREELLGGTRFAYQLDGWRLVVSVPLLASDEESDGYEVSATGPDAYSWEGFVGPDGVREIAAEPSPTPQAVKDWLGTVHKLPAGSRYDDYVQVIGEGKGQYGVASSNVELAARLDDLADSGQMVRFSGELVPFDDYGDSQIQITELIVLPPPATAQPTNEMVEGWVGVIRPLPQGSAYDDYFDGQQPAVQWGIEGTMAPIVAEIDRYRKAGTPVRIWGVLEYGQADYGKGRINVLRIEPLS